MKCKTMLALIIVFIIAVIFAFLMLNPVKLYFSFYRDEEKNETELVIRYLFINLTLPLKRSKKENTNKAKENIPEKGIRYYYNLYNTLKDDVFKILGFLKEKAVAFDDLSLKINFGYDDAALTGIMTGTLNAVAYNIIGYVHNNFLLKNWEILVTPDFKNEKFEVDFNCIARLKTVHIIKAVLMGIKLLIKIKKTDKKGR